MALPASTASLWKKSLPVRRALLAIFLAVHLLAMLLNSLPWSALVEPLFPMYRPYLGWTGTVQDGWSMYDDVHTWDNHYRIIGERENGQRVPIPYPGLTRPGVPASRLRDFLQERDANFLESIAFDIPSDVQQAFGAYLCRQYPQLSFVELQRLTSNTPPLAEWKRPAAARDYETTTVFSTACS